MNKQVKALVCVILAVWIFLMGFEIGSYKEKKATNTSVTTQSPLGIPEPSTVPPSSSAPTTTAPTTTEAPKSDEPTETPDAPEDTTKPKKEDESKKNNSDDPSSLSKEQIIEKMADAVNTAKASTATVAKNETVTINLTDLSVPSLMSTVQRVMDALSGEETESYTLSNGLLTGTDADGKAVENAPVNDYMPPRAAFAIDPAGVAEASAYKDGDNTIYKLKTIEENTTKDNPIPQYSNAVFSYLDLMSIDIPVPGIQITEANMHYFGTEVTVTVGPDGRLTKLDFNMPMEGTGVASIFVTNGTASFEGSDVESWTFTY